MTTEQFLDFLQRSGLLPAERMNAIQGEVREQGAAEEEADAFAQQLVQKRVITPFQADRLLRGKWRNFIVNEKFRVLDRWDAGDLGVFFRCEHQGLRKNVVLRSHSSLSDDPEHDLKGLLERVRALSQVNDPHLARVIDVERVNDQPLLVMEDLIGPNLEELVKEQGPLSLEQAASYTVQAALGLQALHEADWIHGEVRPARMLFDPTGMLKLLDAGLGPWLGNPRHGSRSKDRLGERGFPLWDYTAPETLLKDPQADARSDLYSLGCVFYHLLAGQPPFASFAPQEKPRAHQMAEPPSLAAARPDVPPAVHQVLASLLAKHPDDRPAHSAELAQQLLPWARELLPPVTQAMLGLASYHEDMPPEARSRRRESAGPAGAKEPRRRSTRKRVMTLVAAALAVGSIGVFVFAVIASFLSISLQDRLEAIQKALANKETTKAAELLVDGLKEATPTVRIVPTASGNAPTPAELARTQLLNLLNQNNNEDLVRTVAKRLPDDPDVQARLGDWELRQKNWDAAVQAFTRATTADPKRAAVWEKLTEAEIRRGNWAQAAERQGRLVELKPDDSALWMRQATLLARAGKMSEYRDLLAKMWRKFKDAKNPPALVDVGLAAAAAAEPVPERSEILPRLQLAASRLPRQGTPHFALGALHFRLGDHDQAVEELRRAYADNPTWAARPICLPLLSLAQYQANQRGEAEKTFRSAEAWQRTEKQKRGNDAFAPLTANWWDWVLFDSTLNEARPVFQHTANP